MNKAPRSSPVDLQAARKQSLGLTRVPYWGHDKNGVRVPLSCWVTLRPGETTAQAAQRLSIPSPEPQWTPQLRHKAQALWQQLLARDQTKSSSISWGTWVSEE